MPKEANIQVLVEKDQTIQELRETIEVRMIWMNKYRFFIKIFSADFGVENKET